MVYVFENVFIFTQSVKKKKTLSTATIGKYSVFYTFFSFYYILSMQNKKILDTFIDITT